MSRPAPWPAPPPPAQLAATTHSWSAVYAVVLLLSFALIFPFFFLVGGWWGVLCLYYFACSAVRDGSGHCYRSLSFLFPGGRMMLGQCDCRLVLSSAPVRSNRIPPPLLTSPYQLIPATHPPTHLPTHLSSRERRSPLPLLILPLWAW